MVFHQGNEAAGKVEGKVIMEALQNDKRYTYADLVNCDTEERYELIDGVSYVMEAPTEAHQRIITNLVVQLHNFLKGKPCRVYPAPFAVCLNADAGDDTVTQPDIVVICDYSKLDKKGYKGAPDLVIEVLSPSTASKDNLLKFNRYLQAGVREYWIVDPDSKVVTVNILDNGKYYITPYGETDTVSVHVLEGCEISLPDVFSEE